MFSNYFEKKISIYNCNWSKGSVQNIKINALFERYHPITYVEMWIPDITVRESITTALKSIFISQPSVFGRSNILQDLTSFGQGNEYIRFSLNSLDKSEVEKVFSHIHLHQGSQLPIENIQQGLEKLFPQKTGVEIKTLLLIAAAVAAAGAVYWGYQKLSQTKESLFYPASEIEDETEERTLFNSFGFGPE